MEHTIIQGLAMVGAGVLSYWVARLASRFEVEVVQPWLLSWRKPQPVTEAAPVTPDITADEFRTVHGWAQLNPWYAADTSLNMEAQIIHMSLRSREPHLTLERNLAHVTAEMHRRHPEIVPTRQ